MFGDEMLICEVARDSVEGFDARHVVARTIGAVFVSADVHADDAASSFSRFETRQRRRVSAIVEPEPVDQAVVGDEPEDARLRVARLRFRRHRSRFGKAAAHRQHGIGHARILVEASGDTDRIWKVEAKNRLAQNRIVGSKRARMKSALERFQRRFVRVLWVQREKRRTR